MMKKHFLIAMLLSFLPATMTFAGKPPPMCLLEGTCKKKPSHSENHVGPRIGINVEPYSVDSVKGVLVVEDNSKRELWYLNEDKERTTATFSENEDVILRVNDTSVRSSADVLKNTYPGWNKLTIKDLGKGGTGDYWVELPAKE